MAGVFIDIPGIGNVEAKNAASEATLQAILKALGGRPAGGGGAATGVAAAGGGGGGGTAGKALGGVAGSALKLAKAFGGLVGVAGQIAGAFVALAEKSIDVVRQIANVGDSLTAAAGVFNNIPIVGGILSSAFGAVAESATKLNNSYLAAAASGASFGGSMNTFVASASMAGMEMGKFGQFIRQNSSNLMAFGSNIEDGAKNFVRISKQVRATSSDLYALGFSTEQINQGIANYGNILRIQGRQGTMTNNQLAEASRKYMKEIDALAKATGMERAEVEAKLAQVQQDAQFHGFMATKSKDVRDSFAALLTTADKASPELAGMIKDYVTTGSFTNAENAKTAGLMGAEAQNTLQMLRNMAVNGQKLTAAQQDEVFRSLGRASKRMTDQYGATLSSTGGEFDHALKTSIGLNKLHDQSLEAATNAQKNATKNSDGMNQGLQKAQEELAAISNEFTLFLASSGLLKDMLEMFKGFVGFVKTFVMPIFSALGSVIKFITPVFEVLMYTLLLFNPVWRGLMIAVTAAKVVWDELSIAFSGFGGVLDGLKVAADGVKTVFNYLYDLLVVGFTKSVRFVIDSFTKIKDTLYDYMYPAFKMVSRIADDVGKMLRDTFGKALEWGSKLLKEDVLPVFDRIGKVLKDTFAPAIKYVSDIFDKVATSVGDFFRSFNKLSEVSEYMSLKWEAMTLQFAKFYLWLDEKMTFTDSGKAELAKKQEKLAEEEAAHKKKTEDLEKRLADNRKKNLEEQKADEKKREEERKKRDDKRDADRKRLDERNADHKKGLDTAGAKTAADEIKKAVECANMDYNAGPEALLKQFAEREGSPVAKQVRENEKAVAKAKAEAANPSSSQSLDAQKKAIIESEMEKQRKQQEAAEELRKQMAASGTVTGDAAAMALAGQNSPQDVIAALNTNMALLVKQNKELVDLNAKQLSVQRGLTNDVFTIT